MAFIATEFLQRAKLTLFFERVGKTDDGKPKIRLHKMAKVTPFDASTGYAHDTYYYTPIQIPVTGGAAFDEWAEIALEESTQEHPSVTATGNGQTRDQQVIHSGPKV